MKKIEKVQFSCDLSFLKNKSLLITGGTGSFGQALTNTLLDFGQLKKLIIFSRDEYKQLLRSKLNLNVELFFIYFESDPRNVRLSVLPENIFLRYFVNRYISVRIPVF